MQNHIYKKEFALLKHFLSAAFALLECWQKDLLWNWRWLSMEARFR